MRRGFTLTELVIVIIIIGILVTLAATHYGGTRERAFDREATANLKLIQAALRVYRMEGGAFFNSSDNTVINRDLKLSLQTANPRWNYQVDTAGCGQATRTGGARAWCFRIDDGFAPGSDGEPHLSDCTACP